MRSPGSLTVAIADRIDPADAVAGSGASASLVQAMGEVVARVIPLSGELPWPVARAAHLSSVATRIRPGDRGDLRGAVKRAHAPALLARPSAAARSLLMRRRLAQAGPLDAVIQRASDMLLPRSCKIVTLEDSTVLQARDSYPWAHLQGLTDADVRRYADRQRRVYESAVACCCATHWVAESIIGSYGIAPDRVFTVGLGQNHDVGEPAPRDWSRPRYLFIGVDWERKNGAAVVAAFAQLREQHPDAQLDLVGGHPPIAQPGVVAHGRLSLARAEDRERIKQLYRTATAFVMPSLHEPAGLVYIEAGGAGVPSIGTTNGGAATMIGPGGILVDPLAPDQILAAMLALAEPNRARRLGELAYEHSKLFTWHKVAERLIRAIGLPDVDVSGLAEFL
jgi:glycosyltransferase involved in cell wall biosynthesis